MNNLFNIDNIQNFQKGIDKTLRHIFSPFIKESFLIDIKYLVIERFKNVYKYYDFDPNLERVLIGNAIPDYDICRTIVGCHSSNVIFLSDGERVQLERNTEYKNRLVQNVIDNIKLRRYGSIYFRNRPIMRGEHFLYYNIPYKMFVISMRMNEILRDSKFCSKYAFLYNVISNKALATLSLLEVNFLDNCYPICRAIIEIFLKLVILNEYPELIEYHNKFTDYELDQSHGEQKYPEEFNNLFSNRINKSDKNKIGYLHFGWVDHITDYHKAVKKHAYSINGILEFLLEKNVKNGKEVYENLQILFKMCHGYTHGNIVISKYPVLHYFEISILLSSTVSNAYSMLCDELDMPTDILGIDISKSIDKDLEILSEQYEKRSTENFDLHYKRIKAH